MAKERDVLGEQEKADFFNKHFPHRLTLLRTFRYRGLHLPHGKCSMDWLRDGDLIRCAKDASIMAVRFWLEFFNLKGVCVNGCREDCRCTSFKLKEAGARSTDVRVQLFVTEPIQYNPGSKEASILGKVYVIGDKHVAHLTLKAADRGELDHELVAQAAEIIENLIRDYLYAPCGREMPSHPIVAA
jgi:hypothetical protein